MEGGRGRGRLCEEGVRDGRVLFCSNINPLPYLRLALSFPRKILKEIFLIGKWTAYQIVFPQGNLDLGFCARLCLYRTGRGRGACVREREETVSEREHSWAGEREREAWFGGKGFVRIHSNLGQESLE